MKIKRRAPWNTVGGYRRIEETYQLVCWAPLVTAVIAEVVWDLKDNVIFS
jgi:hypothetical protein